LRNRLAVGPWRGILAAMGWGVRSPALVAAGLAAVAGGLGVASPASAHGPRLPDAAYYRTELTVVTPSPAGVAAHVTQDGEWLELVNTGPSTVVVLGYGGEPYLKLTRTQVWRNLASPTTALNGSLFTTVPLTDAGSAAPAAARWSLAGSNGTIRWHDHRIHWMGAARPPAVAADPSRPRLIGVWTVHARADRTPFEIRGTLRWLGRPPAYGGLPAWLVVALLAGAACSGLLLVLLFWREAIAVGRRESYRTGPDRPAGTRAGAPP
jgi:hypothetical protein